MLDCTHADEDLIMFRDTVRRMAEKEVAPIAAKIDQDDDMPHSLIPIFGDLGLIQIMVPEAYGGPGGTTTMACIAKEEVARASFAVSHLVGATSIAMALPLVHYGTEEQRQRYLPEVAQGRILSCIGLTEPHTGSDVSGIKTSARRDGDSYVVNDQKIWTTWAHWADWMFCLVRTGRGDKPQAGISFLLIDMRSPGITVRPIRTIDGDTEVNEVFLDNVRVPAENLIGDEGGGWTYAKVLLEHERFIMSGAPRSRRDLDALRALDPGGRFAARMAALDNDLLALEYLELRLLSTMNAGQNPGPRASALKIRGTEIAQAISRLRLDLARAHDGPLPDVLHHAEETWLNLRKLAIWGGSNEIQRNVMAKAVLGLRG